MFKVKRRFPNFFTGFEETEHVVKNKEELENIEWVRKFIENETFHTLAISDDGYGYPMLMVFNNYDEEYNGCKEWWVIGYIIEGDNLDNLELPDSRNLYGNHKDGCPQKEHSHNNCTCGFKGE